MKLDTFKLMAILRLRIFVYAGKSRNTSNVFLDYISRITMMEVDMFNETLLKEWWYFNCKISTSTLVCNPKMFQNLPYLKISV